MQPYYIASVLLLLAILHRSESHDGLEVHSPEEIRGTYLSGPISAAPEVFVITGEVVCMTYAQLCDDEMGKTVNITGKIVMLGLYSSTGIVRCATLPSEAINLMLPYSPLGLVIREQQTVGYSEILEPVPVISSAVLPAVSLGRYDYGLLDEQCKKGALITATMTNPGRITEG
jgi:hypothetical protein